MRKSVLEKIEAHYDKAVKTHPEFLPSGMMFAERGFPLVHSVLDFVRKFNEDAGVATAYSILHEEVLEIEEAFAQGDKAHAESECYDAIAVLLRMAEMMEDKNGTQRTLQKNGR